MSKTAPCYVLQPDLAAPSQQSRHVHNNVKDKEKGKLPRRKMEKYMFDVCCAEEEEEEEVKDEEREE